MQNIIYGISVIVIGFVLSISAFVIDEGQSSILYWGILPGIPFVLLGIVSLTYKQPFIIYPFIGAAIGSLLAVSVPYALLFYSAATYTVGGANIGLGLLLLALPVYLILFTTVGWYIGKCKTKRVQQKCYVRTQKARIGTGLRAAPAHPIHWR